MPHDATFPDLPFPDTQDGAPRRTGVEVEFSGLDVDETCKVLTGVLGGEISGEEPFLRDVSGTEIGGIKVELDTPAREAGSVEIVRKGLDVAAAVVPVEVITEPLDMAQLRRFNEVIPALQRAGASGTRAGVFLGFGVHLNPEVVAPSHPHTLKTIVAFGLLEDYLRKAEHLDMTRRALPFVKPWPDPFVTELLEADLTEIGDLFPIAKRHIDTRNHGLDLLPLLRHIDEDRYAQAFPGVKSGARPTFHFRLPDCRIDEPSWDLSQSWALWHLVESVAVNDAAMNDLGKVWLERRKDLIHGTSWAEDVEDYLRIHGFGDAL